MSIKENVSVRKPTHEPGTEWSRAEVEALLAEHERPVDAARAAGITRQRMSQLMASFGIAAPVCDPRAQPVNQGREKALVTVSLRADQHAWLNSHGRGLRSALVQQAVDLLMGPQPPRQDETQRPQSAAAKALAETKARVGAMRSQEGA